MIGANKTLSRTPFILFSLLIIFLLCIPVYWKAIFHFEESGFSTTLPTPPPCPPSFQNILGTDDRGRDIATRIAYGLRNTLGISVITSLLWLLLGLIIGVGTAVFGRKTDLFGQFLSEITRAIPVLYLFLIMATLWSGPWAFIISYVLISWGGIANAIRVQTHIIKKQDYITAARSLGVSRIGLVKNHILPALTPFVLSFMPFLLMECFFILNYFEFLGIGMVISDSNIGEIFIQARENPKAWWLITFPSLAIFVPTLVIFQMMEQIKKIAQREKPSFLSRRFNLAKKFLTKRNGIASIQKLQEQVTR